MPQPDYDDLVFPPQEHFVELTEKVKGQDEELQRLRKGWELYSHETVITKQLRQLLKEAYNMLARYQIENEEPCIAENVELLTRIDEVLK